MCPKTCLTTGGIHANHDKLQAHKVTERNSIHIDDFHEHNKLDEGIMEDIQEYSFNNNFVYSLLGDDATQNKGFKSNGLHKEVCKQCGRSARALHRPPKALCSLGCALKFKFDMTLKDIHNVQIWLRETTIDVHRISLRHIHMAIAFMDTMDSGNDMRFEHMLHPRSTQTTRLDKKTRLSMTSNAKAPPPSNPQKQRALKKHKEILSQEDEIVLPFDPPRDFKRLKKAKDKVTYDGADLTLQVMPRGILVSNTFEYGKTSSKVVNSNSKLQPLDTHNDSVLPSEDASKFVIYPTL